ncbi:hypothetical protein Snov_1952 [Ancylobacter novellus DSM 506]|uniref:Uncharacterized protein n=1 Tax=Ancylobacter novellus (strain ATCC 8093 / DSM 506 / JCM 20403 / CCM 1077 / IAM 12100 / NBRC 12443 / NCIMB 10456) TaxID=639283 RepID=D6ZZB6_ANCN5|nr:hypothetical protein [Ancylobacter novellus]ADH89252.1 hypothetical protein Snov_1952 [Ancylobacter novellus DSM 506]
MAYGRDLLTTYDKGTISVAHGSRVVRGQDVFWLDVQSCDSLMIGDISATIAAVDASSLTTIELAAPWCGETAEDVTYLIRFDAPSRFPGYMGHADA